VVPAALLGGFGVACELDRAGLGKRGGELLVLAPASAVHRDIPCATAINPRASGTLEQHGSVALLPTLLPTQSGSPASAETLQTRTSAGDQPAG
jgi:hypothetical protein